MPTAPPLIVKAVPTVPVIAKKEEAKPTKKPNNKKVEKNPKKMRLKGAIIILVTCGVFRRAQQLLMNVTAA